MDGVTIPTWIVDSDGDFTMTHGAWTMHAWFRINLNNPTQLVLNIVSSRNHRMTRELYGVYHGRMTATLLAYFDHMIDTVTSTAMPTTDDIIISRP